MPANMCDGCMAGLPLEGGIHVSKDGTLVMVCQKSRYTDSEWSIKNGKVKVKNDQT